MKLSTDPNDRPMTAAERAAKDLGDTPMPPTGSYPGPDGTVSVYLTGDAGPQRWTLGEPVECEPGCGCWECITDPADAPA